MNIKKVLSCVVTFAVLLFLSSATLVSAAETEAVASSDSTKVQLTEEQLEQINMVYFNRLAQKEDMYSNITKFALADINGDGINELFGTVDSSYNFIYTFANGELEELLYKGKFSEVKYHSATGVVEVDWGASEGTETDYYTYYQDGLKFLAGSGAMYDFDLEDYSGWVYVIENQYVTQTEYDSFVSKLIDLNNPDGDLKWIKNTEVNRLNYFYGVVKTDSKSLRKEVAKKLKGTWGTGSYDFIYGKAQPMYYVRFTNTYIKYGHKKKGKYVLDYKDKIQKVMKLKDGSYLIQAKHKKYKYTFQTDAVTNKCISYYGTWDAGKFMEKYTGTESLTKVKKF